MKDMKNFSRRTLLKGMAGTAAASGLVGTNLLPGRANAQAVGEKAALLVVFLDGGFNAVFNSADSFAGAGTFGVTAGNQLSLGNGLVVDAPTFGTMPVFAREHMATIGLRHGITNHGAARTADMSDGTRSYMLQLAAAMGGDAAIKAAVLGNRMPAGPRPPEGGVTLQTISDMQSTIAALGGQQDPTIPDRAIGAKGLQASQAMSQGGITTSQRMLVSLKEGYQAGIETLQKPIQQINFPTLAAAYNHPATTFAVTAFRSQMVAAELMILSGANVVFAAEGGWDSHGDRSAAAVRNQMNTEILPSLNVFLNRMVGVEGRNVVVAILGDFARSLPGSDHAASLATTVIGKKVMVGTTGKVSANVQLAAGTPAAAGFWAYLAKALAVPTEPFGANPHPLIRAA